MIRPGKHHTLYAGMSAQTFLPGYLWWKKTPHKLPTVRTHILAQKCISSGSYQRVWGPQKQQQTVTAALKKSLYLTPSQKSCQYTDNARLQLVCAYTLASFSRANLTLLPCFMLILLTPRLQQHEVEMLGPYTVLTLYRFRFSLSFPFFFHQLIFCSLLLHCLWVFISHLAWKGNKSLTYWRSLALLYHFVLSLPVFYFCLWQQTLSGSWVRDKPSMVLCGEIIWQPDKAWWVSSSLLLLSSHLLPSPEWARKSPVGLRVIQTHQSGFTYGKMSALPFWHMNCMLHVRILQGMHV